MSTVPSAVVAARAVAGLFFQSTQTAAAYLVLDALTRSRGHVAGPVLMVTWLLKRGLGTETKRPWRKSRS